MRFSFLCVAAAVGLAQAVRDAVDREVTVARGKHTLLKLQVPRGAKLSPLADVRANGTSLVQGSSAVGGFPEELAWFKDYEAVQSRWVHTLTTQPASAEAIAILDQVKAWEVPGLGGVKFADVLTAVQERCPLWLVGGAVRDLVAGEVPNDIDCIALCETSVVAQVASVNNWEHIYTEGQAYFAIGETHGDDPHYLEGFSGDLLFTHPDMPEMTTSMLLWALSTNTIVDPSGTGVTDAQKKLLRPAVPDPEGTFKTQGQKAQKLWKARQAWLLGGFAGPRLARHVRYIKMRMRGWKPADACVRTFMANTLAAMVYVERVLDREGSVEAFGSKWPSVPLATLMMLMDKFAAAPPEAKKHAMDALLQVYEEDMKDYLEGTADKQCSQYWVPPFVIKMDKETSTGVWWNRNKPKSVKDVIKKGVLVHCSFAVTHDQAYTTICQEIKELSRTL